MENLPESLKQGMKVKRGVDINEKLNRDLEEIAKHFKEGGDFDKYSQAVLKLINTIAELKMLLVECEPYVKRDAPELLKKIKLYTKTLKG